MQRRQEILNDITDTVGSVFVGLTYGCARCHDHKFDPIRQADYYRLQAFFASSAAADHIALAPAETIQQYEAQMAVWEERTRAIREQLQAIEEPKREEIIKDYVNKYPDEIQVALAKPASERTPFEAQMAAKARLYPLKIGARGNLQEWFEDFTEAEVHHRHVSHLFGVHPGRQRVPGVDPDGLRLQA